MNDLLFSLNTISPLLLLMAIGFLARRTGLLNGSLVSSVNQLIFKLFLPANLFYNIFTMSDDMTVSGSIFILVPAGLVVMFLTMLLLIPKLEKDPKKIGVIIQGIFRSNYAIFGIPLISMLFPDKNISLASLMVIVTIPIYNVLAVVALSVFCGGELKLKKILLNILKNPLIISVVLGFALWGLNVELPSFAQKTISDLSKVSTPLALFTLGGSIQLASTKAHAKQLTICVLGKLVVFPAIFVTIAALMGLRDVALVCVFISFGAPTAVSSFPMAQQMGGDGELAAEQVALTTVFSILTTFLCVYLLKSLMLI